jgi:hypothetical protein
MSATYRPSAAATAASTKRLRTWRRAAGFMPAGTPSPTVYPRGPHQGKAGGSWPLVRRASGGGKMPPLRKCHAQRPSKPGTHSYTTCANYHNSLQPYYHKAHANYRHWQPNACSRHEDFFQGA